jgi:RNA recognition motif-containing protein
MYNIKCRLFVGNISENYSSTDLQELFSKYGTSVINRSIAITPSNCHIFIGEVVEATINVDLKTKRNLSYGFITYAKSESAQLAMIDLDGFEIHGRPLR